MTDRRRQKPPRSSEEVRKLSDLQLVTETALTHLNLDNLLNDLVSRLRQIFSTDTAEILLL
jgi:hypothetical protein